MKNIAYLIFNNSHGKGGHFYSLKTTVKSLQKSLVNPIIITIGYKESPIVNESFENSFFIAFNGYNYLTVLKKLNDIFTEYQIEVIHSFDIQSSLFSRILSLKNNLPMIVTKCGGGNLNYTPFVKNFIMYSNENLEYLKKQNKFKETKFYLIPNRVNKVVIDKNRIIKLVNKYKVNKEKIVFLRISRFVEAYEESMIQAINIVKELQKNELSTQLLLIGEIQSTESYKRIQEYSKNMKNIILITDAEFTSNASELIDVADCIVGTGRGVMEAASCQKILFTPLKNKETPVLIDSYNILDLLKTNFSPRNQLKSFKNNENIIKSIQLLKSEEDMTHYKVFSKQLFREYFDIESVTKLYEELYATSVIEENIKYIDLFLHILYVSRSYITSRRKFK